MKALAILRVSTTSQEIDEQRDELMSFIRSQGYDEIIPLEAVGASAIKMDDKYMELVGKVKEAIETDKSIKAACVWELSRLGRNEVILMEFKEFFIKNHIQFICKNPYMMLLNSDGTVNAGMELAFSLFATMSKQEMIEKKARFKRTKKANAAKGKYTGGNTRKFGFAIDRKGYFVEDPEEGYIVKLIFDLYSTGKYSTYTLAKELDERGIKVTDNAIGKILRCKAYTGEPVKGIFDVYYPALISREVFDRCQEIRQQNKIEMKRGDRVCIAAKLVKCPVCGATCTSNSRHYVCSRHAHHGPCANGFALRQEVADDLCWRTAHGLHMNYLLELDETKKEEYRKEKEIVDGKIAEAERKMEDFTSKKDRIVEAFLEGLIDRKNRDLRLSKLQDDVRSHQEYLSGLQGKSMALARMLEGGQKDAMQSFLDAREKMETETMFDIVHQHIEKLVARQVSFGKRDPRTTRPNAVEIIVTSVYGEDYKYMYIPKYYQGHNLYIWEGKKWVADRITKAVHHF